MNEKEKVLEKTRSRLREIAAERNLLHASVAVLAKPLTPEEAIGEPGRRDFPIIIGKERVVESVVLGSKGHAFTDSPREFMGNLEDVLALDLNTNQNRAIFVSTLNAVLAGLDMVTGTVHCKDDEPEQCAQEIATLIFERHGKTRVGLIGLNPAIGEKLVEVFGADQVRFSDLNKDNVGKRRFGVEVLDGRSRTGDLIDAVDVVLVSGTTLINGTFDQIWSLVKQGDKACMVYGVTAAGVSLFAGFERICPCGRAGRDVLPDAGG